MSKEMSLKESYDFWKSKKGKIYDIRDDDSFKKAHIPGAQQLNEDIYKKLIEEKGQYLICCYHGVSSLNVVNSLREQGVNEVWSMVGGMEEWKKVFPQDIQSQTKRSFP